MAFYIKKEDKERLIAWIKWLEFYKKETNGIN